MTLVENSCKCFQQPSQCDLVNKYQKVFEQLPAVEIYHFAVQYCRFIEFHTRRIQKPLTCLQYLQKHQDIVQMQLCKNHFWTLAFTWIVCKRLFCTKLGKTSIFVKKPSCINSWLQSYHGHGILDTLTWAVSTEFFHWPLNWNYIRIQSDPVPRQSLNI